MSSHVSAEGLVADERRIARSAIEALGGPRRPLEKVALVHESRRRTLSRCRRCIGVAFHANTVWMAGDEAAIAAGWVEESIRVAADSPLHQGGRDRIGRVVRPALLRLLGDHCGFERWTEHGRLRRVSLRAHDPEYRGSTSSLVAKSGAPYDDRSIRSTSQPARSCRCERNRVPRSYDRLLRLAANRAAVDSYTKAAGASARGAQARGRTVQGLN